MLKTDALNRTSGKTKKKPGCSSIWKPKETLKPECERILKQSVSWIANGRKPYSFLTKHNSDNQETWTSWFNIDHPGGNGDYERLDAIRFYYRNRVCPSPIRIEARTTDWVPATSSGQAVHSSVHEGFWCLNKEQPPGQTSCSGKCDRAGVQTRRRTCLADTFMDLRCKDISEEERACLGPPCKVCNMTCSRGWVNADCSACFCQEYLLHGTVALQDGAPAAGARLYLQAKPSKFLTESGHNGAFEVPGVCPDGKTTLQIKKSKYATAVITLSEKKPYVTMHPENKARREGQSVSFCCHATGNPPPGKYLWFHNDTLLDPAIYKYKSNLILKNLKMNQAGWYFCKTSNEAGSVKSQSATLSLTGKNQASCDSSLRVILSDCPTIAFRTQPILSTMMLVDVHLLHAPERYVKDSGARTP
ncbi:hypothetical protein E2320_013554 [Naja naja]|nr:hypothetical protein E2320_013554 [Naja naja]